MPNVTLATAGYDHTIKFWEAVSGVCYNSIQFNESQVNCLVVSPNRNLLAASGIFL